MKRKKSNLNQFSFSDVKKCMFCLQIGPESFALFFRRDLDDLLRMRDNIHSRKWQHINCMCFYISRNNLCRNKSDRDANRVFLFNYHNFMKMKYFLFKSVRAYDFVPVTFVKKD